MGGSDLMADAGKAMMLYKGVYDSTIEYEILDVVNYNGSLYISKINNNLDYEPTLDETKWQLFLEGGTSENIKVTDTQGIVGDAGSSSFVQTLLDGIAEKVVNIISGSEVVKKATQAETATKATQDGNGNNIMNTYVNKSKILDTAELISANTASGNVAGALAVKTIQANLNNKVPLAYGDIGNADEAPEGWCSLASSDGKNNPTTFWVSLHTHYINSAKTYGTQEAYPWAKHENGDFWIRNKDNGIWSEWVYVGKKENKYVKLWSGSAVTGEMVTFTTDISKLNWRKLLISFYYSSNNNTVFCELPSVYTSIQRNIFMSTFIGTIHTIPTDVQAGRIAINWDDSNYRLAEIYAELN